MLRSRLLVALLLVAVGQIAAQPGSGQEPPAQRRLMRPSSAARCPSQPPVQGSNCAAPGGAALHCEYRGRDRSDVYTCDCEPSDPSTWFCVAPG